MTRAVRSTLLAVAILLSSRAMAQPEPRAGAEARETLPPVTACAYTPDGVALAAARGTEVFMLSSADGRVERTLACDGQRVTSLAFSPAGDVLAVGGGVPGESGRVLLIDWKSGRVVTSAGEFDDVTTSVAFSPDAQRLAAASADGTVGLFNVPPARDRLEPAARLEGHAGPVLSVVFGDDATVVTAGADRSIKAWDATTGALRRTLSNHTDVVHSLVRQPAPPPAPSGNADDADDDHDDAKAGNPPTPVAPFTCASGSDDHTVRIWQPGVGRMVRIIRGHDGPVLAVCYAPDGATLYAAGAEGIVRAIAADGDAVTRQWPAAAGWVYALAVRPDGRQLATGDERGNVKFWRLDGAEVRPDPGVQPAK